LEFLDRIGGKFLKSETPSPKPARIPPQTPPAGGTEAEAGQIHIPSQTFRPAESALVFRIFRKMGSDFFKQTPPKLITGQTRSWKFSTYGRQGFSLGPLDKKTGRNPVLFLATQENPPELWRRKRL